MILLLAVDLNAIKSMPNLEHRSDMALDYADTALDNAHDDYAVGDIAKWRSEMGEVRDAIALSFESLEQSGKNARNDRHYKRAELKTRELLRRLDGARDDVSFDDRAVLDQVRAKVSEIHDALLQSIMSKKKK
ncbi:MAG TPA: hypothetical protein VMB85_17935 [Bryobacteraceae bacterium]|nr:hypothetical protein [Bryobacteraceae bacterium]